MKLTALICLCAAGAALAGDEPGPAAVTKETALTFYRGFKRLTKEPHRVAPLTAALCRSPSPELIEREKRATGPHYKTLIHLYANALAEDAITRKLAVFPAGSIIVKEKLGPEDSVSGVGGMIKRAPGYDAKNGDWEYFYLDTAAGFATGRLANCIDCHAEAKSADYLFIARKKLAY